MLRFFSSSPSKELLPRRYKRSDPSSPSRGSLERARRVSLPERERQPAASERIEKVGLPLSEVIRILDDISGMEDEVRSLSRGGSRRRSEIVRREGAARERGHAANEDAAEGSDVELIVGEAGDVQRFGADFVRRVGPGESVPD